MGICSSKHEYADPFPLPAKDLRECGPPMDCKYSIAGTFSGWEPQAMTWDTDQQCFNYVVSIGDNQWEAFQILAGGSWDKVYYPSIKDANPSKIYTVRGPDNQNKGLNWVIGQVSRGMFGADERVVPGMRYKVNLYVDRHGNAESVTWDLYALLPTKSTSEMLLDGTKEEPAVPYSIAGTWNDWQPRPMVWDGTCFSYIVRIGKNSWESFQFLQDSSWEKAIYPSVNNANPYMHYELRGPNNQNKGLNWTIGAVGFAAHRIGTGSFTTGTKVKVKLYVDSRGKPRHVGWDMYTGSRSNRPTVMCIAGLASGSLEVKADGADTHEVCWVRVKELIQRPAKVFQNLRLRIVDETLKDGSRVKCTASREGCDVRAFSGIDGIKTLNPTGHIPVPVWAPLIDELEGDFSWHAFNYDWRRWGDQKFAEELVDRFRTEIEQAIKEDGHPSRKASLICHSMGAAVALYFLGELGDEWVKTHIKQLVLVAPAHMGSPSMISSYAHCPFVDTQSWVPIPVAFDKTLGDLTSTWACMVAELPVAVGGELPWPEDYVFVSTPQRQYRLQDIGQFLEDLESCKPQRETGPAFWPGVQKLASKMKAPVVPTSIIYSDRIDTPAQLEYLSSDLSKKPKLKSSEPGDGTIVASSIEAVGRAWQQKGACVQLIKDPCPKASDHKELISCPFSVGVIPKVLKGGILMPISVTIVSASGLKNADYSWAGLSDPYCRFMILGKPSTKRETPVVDNCLDPVWNYTANLYAYDEGDVLSFVVYDKDPGFADGDFLGCATLELSSHMKDRRSYEGTLKLENGEGLLMIKVTMLEDAKGQAYYGRAGPSDMNRMKARGGA
eukprot:TRINITY_DN80088_c0_g1_i1.p1 TRINITY_DN80088_c0_g1~~TRINITY_DN80088_c0_g1_i1.p1  ORF type:complete len:837 (+),score=113.13 TRINITY_DN80088_c0_g1_i1:127-2637(+)